MEISESSAQRFRRIVSYEIRSAARAVSLTPRSWRFRSSGWLLRHNFFYAAYLCSPGLRRNRGTMAPRNGGLIGTNAMALRLLNGKSVAIVGPCVGPDHVAAIDEHQMVARVSHSADAPYPDGTGTRCDISYYAGWKLVQMARDGTLVRSLDSLKMVVVRSRKLATRLVGKERLRHLLEASGTGLDSRFYPVKPNAIPQLIEVVLSAGASKVTILNVDLFTGSYSNHYQRRSEHVRNASLESLELHNPFTHFKYFRELHRDPRVNVDDRLAEVLKNTPWQYSRAIRDRP